MKAKTPSLKLCYIPGLHMGLGRAYWLVVQVTNSIEFTPGQRLSRKQVANLVARPDWRVSITQQRRN